MKAQNEAFKKIQKELTEKQLKASFQNTKTSKDNTSFNLVMDAIEVYAALNSTSKRMTENSKLEEHQVQALKELDENIRRQINITNKKKFAENRNHYAMRRRIKKLSEFTLESQTKFATKTQRASAESKEHTNAAFWIKKIEELQTPIYLKAINELLVSVLREGLHDEYRSQYIPDNLFSILEDYNPQGPFSTSEYSLLHDCVGYITRKNGSHHGYALHSDAALKFIRIYGNLNWIKAVLGTIPAEKHLSEESIKQLRNLFDSIEAAQIPLTDHIDELFDSFSDLREQQNIFNYIDIVIDSIESQIKDNWINKLTNTRESPSMPNTESKISEAEKKPTALDSQQEIAINKQKIKVLRAELRRIILDERTGLSFYANKYGTTKYSKEISIEQFIEEVTAKTTEDADKQQVAKLKETITKIVKKINQISDKNKRLQGAPVLMPEVTPSSKIASPVVASNSTVSLPGSVPVEISVPEVKKEDKSETNRAVLEEVKEVPMPSPKANSVSLLTEQLKEKKEELKNVDTEILYYPNNLRHEVTDIHADESINYKIKTALINHVYQNNRRKSSEKQHAMVQAIENLVCLHLEPGHDEKTKIENLEDRFNKLQKLAIEYGLSTELIEEDKVFFQGLNAIKKLILLDENLRQLYAYSGYINKPTLSEFKGIPLPEHKESSVISYQAFEKWATTINEQISRVELPRIIDIYKQSAEKTEIPQRPKSPSNNVEFKKPDLVLFLDSDDERSPKPSPILSPQKSIVKKMEVNKPTTFHERHKGKIRWGSLIFGILGVAAGVFLALTPTFGVGQLVGSYLIYQGCTIAACAVGAGLGASAVGALSGTLAGVSSDCCRGGDDQESVRKISKGSNASTLKQVGGLASHPSTVREETDQRIKPKEAFKDKQEKTAEAKAAPRIR